MKGDSPAPKMLMVKEVALDLTIVAHDLMTAVTNNELFHEHMEEKIFIEDFNNHNNGDTSFEIALSITTVSLYNRHRT